MAIDTIDAWSKLIITSTQLKEIYEAIPNFERFSTIKYSFPIIDALTVASNLNTDTQGVSGFNASEISIQGLKAFRESVKRDLEGIEKFIAKGRPSASSPLPSTNAPYLIAIWNELLHATSPILAVDQTFPASKVIAGKAKLDNVKIDIVCDGGAHWIRVNTIKNSRLLAEFREIDSYLTDSDESTGSGNGASSSKLATTELDNSILRMGRSLITAAKANPINGNIPKVTLCLTRLGLDEKSLSCLKNEGLRFVDDIGMHAVNDDSLSDPRIYDTVLILLTMGLDVVLGEVPYIEFITPSSSTNIPPKLFIPTSRINLDLSMLVALVSDLTHAPLPESEDELRSRFIPSIHEKERMRLRKDKFKGRICSNEVEESNQHQDNYHDVLTNSQDNLEMLRSEQAEVEGDEGGSSIHSRALAHQAIQELKRSLVQEISERLRKDIGSVNTKASSSESPDQLIEFWTTPEARDRCLRIVQKIGGEAENRRAKALFRVPANLGSMLSESEACTLYWRNSRHDRNAIPVAPIHVFESNDPSMDVSHSTGNSFLHDSFWKGLVQTCRQLLSGGTIQPPEAIDDSGEIQRAAVLRANPRLTEHTVHSLIWGAALGWTTLTANKSSIRTILREMKNSSGTQLISKSGDVSERISTCASVGHDVDPEIAALWIVEPRSLAEGMSRK